MNTNLENAKAQMRKGVLELCILSIIAEREAYPSDVLEKLKASSLLVVEGTLYPILTRMKDSGYLEYRWIETGEVPLGLGGPKKGGGPPRKYYNLTEAGRLALSDMQTAWNELVASVAQITNLPENPNASAFVVKEKEEDAIFLNKTSNIISNENEIV